MYNGVQSVVHLLPDHTV